MCSQELLQCIHTNQLFNSGHRGANQSYITNFAETIRQFQALQTEENKLSDQMRVDFLNNSMRGTTYLEGILDTYYTTRKAAGIPYPFNITFKEHVERLIQGFQAAQPHDASLGQTRSRGGRSANFHSILGGESDEEDDSEDEENSQAALEYNNRHEAQHNLPVM